MRFLCCNPIKEWMCAIRSYHRSPSQSHQRLPLFLLLPLLLHPLPYPHSSPQTPTFTNIPFPFSSPAMRNLQRSSAEKSEIGLSSHDDEVIISQPWSKHLVVSERRERREGKRRGKESKLTIPPTSQHWALNPVCLHSLLNSSTDLGLPGTDSKERKKKIVSVESSFDLTTT